MTHTLPLIAPADSSFLVLISSFQNHLRKLCSKRSARVGHLFRRENLGSKYGLFLAAILQDFHDLNSNASEEICFFCNTVLV